MNERDSIDVRRSVYLFILSKNAINQIRTYIITHLNYYVTKLLHI